MASVTCTGADEIPDGWLEEQAAEWAQARLADSRLPETPPPPVLNGCGRTFDYDDDGPWDVKTDENGKTVSRHRDVVCPACGARTFVQEG